MCSSFWASRPPHQHLQRNIGNHRSPTGLSQSVRHVQGRVSVVDVRANNASPHYVQLHGRKINTIDFRKSGLEDEACFATSSSSGEVSMFDLRKLGDIPGKAKTVIPVCAMQHLKSCHSAHFHPGGAARLVTTSYDDRVRVWNTDTTDSVHCFKHNNQVKAGDLSSMCTPSVWKRL
jgi:WD40 repeat protein